MKTVSLKILSMFFMLGLWAEMATALDIDGNGDRAGIQALYLFKNYDPATGKVPDTSGVGQPIDLTVDKPANVSLRTVVDPLTKSNVTGLHISASAAVKSLGAATKINAACGASNEFTLEMWVRNLSEEPVGRPQPVRLVSLARKSGTTHDGNFYLGQKYDNSGAYEMGIRSGGNIKMYSTPDEKGRLLFGSQQPAQKIVFTKNKDGVSRLWVSNAAGILQRNVEMTGAGSIAGWATDANRDSLRLSLGNDPYYADFPEYVNGKYGPEWKAWTGTLYVLAIYCEALEPADLLGEAAPGTTTLPVHPVNPNEEITAERKKAHMIYKRITGANTSIDNPVVKQMETMIAADPVGAALLATREPAFYNLTVRDMAARMSTRDLTVNTTLNDMVATIIGVARDDIDAKQLLVGNFSYRANPILAAVPNNEISDFLKSNKHYEALEEGRFDLAKVLVKVDGQKLYNGATGAIVLNPDSAGVITSRAFMAAHAFDGTNRRNVEFAFRVFLCIPINQWADATGTDTYVGRDVDRAPGADLNKYKTTCRACHSVMDGFRGAFAKVDFSAEYLKHGDVMFGLNGGIDRKDDEGLMYQEPMGISAKMNRNSDTFVSDFLVSNTSWVNNANRGLNKEYFGWPEVPVGKETHTGNGIRSFAALISDSKAFPRCMATRAFRSVCKRDPTSAEQAVVQKVAQDFVTGGYKIRDLFARVAVTPECTGQ